MGDQQEQQPRFWFPYWPNPPPPPPPPQSAVRPQLSRRDSRGSPSSASPSLALSQARRPSQDVRHEPSLPARQQPPPPRPIARPTPTAVARSPPASKGAPQPSKPPQPSRPSQKEYPSIEPKEAKPKPTQENQHPLDPVTTKPTEHDTAERKPKPEPILQEETKQQPETNPHRTVERKISPQAIPLQAKEKQETHKELVHKPDEKPKEIAEQTKKLVEKKLPALHQVDEKPKETVEEPKKTEDKILITSHPNPKPATLHQPDEKPKEIVEEPKKAVEKKLSASDPNPRSATPDTEATGAHSWKRAAKHGEANGATSSSSHGMDLQKEIKAGLASLMQKISTLQAHRAPLGQEDGASIITLAGENKGASMQVGRQGSAETKEGGGRRLDDKNEAEGGATGAMRSPGVAAVVNSNVQSINNSLLFQSSCSEGDPGVHLKLCIKSKKKEKVKDEAIEGGTA